jgi:hypothetical protein
MQSREQFPKVRQPGRTRTQHDDRDVEGLDVLLVRQFFIHGDEDIEFRGGQGEQNAVVNMLPAELFDGSGA